MALMTDAPSIQILFTPDFQGQLRTVEEARANLIEAIELFFEVADPSEIASRLKSEVFSRSIA
jgi:predicted RNase H-like HicB family nuclease